MRYNLRYCLKTDLFTHRDRIYKNWEDFSSELWFLIHNTSDLKCIHIYMLPNDENVSFELCDEERI